MDGSAPKVVNNAFVGNDDAITLGSTSAASTGVALIPNNLVTFNGEGINAYTVGGTPPVLRNYRVYGNGVDYAAIPDPTGVDGSSAPLTFNGSVAPIPVEIDGFTVRNGTVGVSGRLLRGWRSPFPARAQEPSTEVLRAA